MTQSVARGSVLPNKSTGEQPISWWYRVLVLLFVFLPLSGLFVAIVLAWTYGVDMTGIALCVLGLAISILGVDIGFHRLFTHNGFKTKPWVEFVLGVAGSSTSEGALFEWVAVHRKHHQYSDKEGDPHSPLLHGSGFWGLILGLLHAHIGWILFNKKMADQERYVGDLKKKPHLVFVDKFFWLWTVLSYAIPTLLAGAIWFLRFNSTEGLGNALLQGFLWGGLARVAIAHHVTWSINSICHVMGTQPFQHLTNKKDGSRNVWILGLLSGGESFHNNHHVVPNSARHGWRWWELDPSWWIIWTMEKIGLATDVVRPPDKKTREHGRLR